MAEIGHYELNLLPFHRMGDSKWTQTGRVYPYRETESTPIERMQVLQQRRDSRSLRCCARPTP